MFGIIFSYVLMTIGVIFLGCAAFLFLQDQFSTEISFTILGVFILIVALAVHLKAKNKFKPKEETPVGLEDDPLSAFLPNIIKENETVKNLVSQISHNPIMATAAAVSLGMLLAHEFFDDED